jgi:hypothetical protein
VTGTEQSTEASKRRPVERAASFQHFVADTAVVEPSHQQITISFMIENMRPSSVDWPKDEDHPLGIGRKRLVEEVAAVRMLPEAANFLAFEILIELAKTGLSRDSFEANFALIRAELDQRDKVLSSGDST